MAWRLRAEINALRNRLGLAPPRIMTLSRDVKEQLASLADDPPEMLLVALGGDQLVGLAPAIADYATAHSGAAARHRPVGRRPGGGADPRPGGRLGTPRRCPVISTISLRVSKRNFNYRPPRIASLAYDSMAPGGVYRAQRPVRETPTRSIRDVLLQPNGFIGIDGGFRFLPNGLSERNLAVLAVNARAAQRSSTRRRRISKSLASNSVGIAVRRRIW